MIFQKLFFRKMQRNVIFVRFIKPVCINSYLHLERRAHSNLGNAQIFLGEFEKAADHYKQTLVLTQDLGDRAVEAQTCYSLGNTYTLLKDYSNAIEYHVKHLNIAKELHDIVGEGRACWSLGNAHSSLGQYLEAYQYAKRHLEISCDTKDNIGQITAEQNLSDLIRQDKLINTTVTIKIKITVQ